MIFNVIEKYFSLLLLMIDLGASIDIEHSNIVQNIENT